MTPTPVRSTETSAPLIELCNITVSRNGKKVLDNVNLKISQGEHLAIIGQNGSGKSSLIKVITGEYHPRADSKDMVMRIMGVEQWNIFDLRGFLGIVSGDLQNEYMRDISGFEAILSGFFGSIGVYSNHIIETEMVHIVREIMDFLDISHLASKTLTEMSTGEARRVLIGRALVHDPRILVLDEASNSLDMKSRQQFRELTRRIAHAGKSIILVTHDLGDIIPEIDRVLLMKDGMVLADGKKSELLQEDTLSEIFDLPVRIAMHGEYYHALY